MEKISMIIISIATVLNAILTIVNFINKAKKTSENIVDNKFKEALTPIKEKIDKIDENQCRNFLVDFLADVEKRHRKRRSANKTCL